jgi:hypothetical protein
MNLNLGDSPKRDNRTLAMGLAAASAALLIFAAFSRNWVARPMPDVGFGPIGCHGCAFDTSGAGNASNSAFVELLRAGDPDAASTAFAPMGWVTFGLCLISALGLLGATLLAYAKQRRELSIAPTTIALLGLMASLITGCVFVATKPGGPGFVGASIGFFAFGIGAVMGIAAAQMLAKLIRPVDADLLDAMFPEA